MLLELRQLRAVTTALGIGSQYARLEGTHEEFQGGVKCILVTSQSYFVICISGFHRNIY